MRLMALGFINLCSFMGRTASGTFQQVNLQGPEEDKRTFSSVGQSSRLITGRSRVRVPEGPLRKKRNKAQWLSWLERRPVTAEVEGSSPFWVASFKKMKGNKKARLGFSGEVTFPEESSLLKERRFRTGKAKQQCRKWFFEGNSGMAV